MAAVPVAAERDEIADFAVVDALDRFLVRALMAALQADADFEVLLLRFFGGGKNAADAGRIGGDRLFHEHMLAGVHGIFEVQRAIAGRAGDDDDIARRRLLCDRHRGRRTDDLWGHRC